jgi:hypothetical protein
MIPHVRENNQIPLPSALRPELKRLLLPTTAFHFSLFSLCSAPKLLKTTATSFRFSLSLRPLQFFIHTAPHTRKYCHSDQEISESQNI